MTDQGDGSALDPETAALFEAVQRAPQDTGLRTALCERLLLHGADHLALSEAQTVLRAVPDNLAALRVAASASERLGELERSIAYWRVLDALRAASEPCAGAGGSDRSAPAAAPLAATSLSEDVPNTTLDDVAGMEEVKGRLQSMFLTPLLNPKLREMYGSELRGGLLLYGPPGCGKTYIARALAGELGTRFVHVGLPDVLDMWLGSSEWNLHELFEQARAQAPMLLFLDEVDVLGASRTTMRSSAMRGVVAQLLVEMDGLVDNNDGVFILGATNQPWNVDPAVRRPGRFDRLVFVAPPDREAREAIVVHHLRSPPTGDDVDPRWIAERTARFSGADLAAVVNEAAQQALMASVRSGEPRPIAHDDLRQALKGRTPSTRAWFDTARNVVSFNGGERGELSDLAKYLDRRSSP